MDFALVTELKRVRLLLGKWLVPTPLFDHIQCSVRDIVEFQLVLLASFEGANQHWVVLRRNEGHCSYFQRLGRHYPTLCSNVG